MNTPVLIIPGIGNSDANHWQTQWQRNNPSFVRLQIEDWENPQCELWTNAIDAAVQSLGPATVLVAHSLGCLALAHWVAQATHPVRGALLVAVPDPHGPAFPEAAQGFSPLPWERFSFPSILVASDNDPYASPEHAGYCADAWGSRLVRAGHKGHLNSASGLGDWEYGWTLLQSLRSLPVTTQIK
ncbi:MAG: alpha/beta hydrolase [Pseudomonadota bacterium]